MKFFTFSIESSGFSVLDLETREKQINVLVSHTCHLCFDPVNPSESIITIIIITIHSLLIIVADREITVSSCAFKKKN